VRAVIGLRRRHAALRDGELRVLGTSGGAFAMARRASGERFLVVTNAGAAPATLALTLPEGWGTAERAEPVDLGDATAPRWSEGAAPEQLELVVAPRSGAILRLG
jgi:hypothetical protein